jgi:predicted porin
MTAPYPLSRGRFHLTERDRNELSASLNFFPSDSLGLSFLALVADDEYPEAKIGLQESEKRSIATDLTYSPTAEWTASIYYNYDNYTNHQAGYGRRGGGNPTPFYPESVRIPANNWSMSSEDDVHSIGAGIDWELMAGKLELSLDANYTDAATETKPFSSGTDFLPLPDITTEISTVSMQGNYQLQPGRELSIGYYYERYQSEDWALDGAGESSLAKILLMGNQSPEYSAHMFKISLIFSL